MTQKYFIVLKTFVFPVVALVAVVSWAGYNLERQITLRNEGFATGAVVVAKRCENHGQIDYEFTADGKLQKAQSSACVARCSDVAIGSRLDIKYLKDDPGLTACGNLDAKIGTQLGFLEFMLVFILAIGVSCLWNCAVQLRKQERKEQANTGHSP